MKSANARLRAIRINGDTINGFKSSFLTQAEKQVHLDRINAIRNGV